MARASRKNENGAVKARPTQQARPVDASSANPGMDIARIDEIRRFNRFYTRVIGLLEQAHPVGGFSLTEVRVMHELAHWAQVDGGAPTATAIGRQLDLDAGYLSRLLRALERRRVVKKEPSPDDGRQHRLQLTASGRTMYAALEQRARESVAALIAPLSDDEQRNVLDALRTVQALLGDDETTTTPSHPEGSPTREC